MAENAAAVPTSLRRIDRDEATRLAGLVGAYDDLQTALRCCERLIALLADERLDPTDVEVEALWSLALLCYARSFHGPDGAAPLAEADLSDPAVDGQMVRWHRVLLHLRDAQADLEKNPRETYSVGIAQDADGAVNAIAVTSAHAPALDAGAIRQAGAMILPLCAVLDERIAEVQKAILADVRDTPAVELEQMDVIEVASVT